MTVKSHQMLHLPHYLRRFGSASHTSMERIEAAHQQLKAMAAAFCGSGDSMESYLCRCISEREAQVVMQYADCKRAALGTDARPSSGTVVRGPGSDVPALAGPACYGASSAIELSYDGT